MKKKSTSRISLAIIYLLLNIGLQTQDVEPVTIHVETAGTLSTLISYEDKYLIKDLTLTGDLNETDFKFIRGMTDLSILNLTDANIVAETYPDFSQKDIISSFMFQNVTNLTSVMIPKNITSIGFGAFYGCTGLTSITIPNTVTEISPYAFRESGLT